MRVPAFVEPSLIAEMTVKALLEIEAVHFRADEPYTFTSGLKAPVYIDCRKLISYPRIRSMLMDFATATILRDIGCEKLDAIAGGETAGIPFAAWIADRLELPMQYVRKKPKGFGRDARIEGAIHEGQRVLLVEDLTTDGGSKVQFADALREAGALVTDTLVIFYYDIFKETRPKLAQSGLRLHQLATWWDVLRVSRDKGYFDEATLNSVEDFLNDPLPWSASRGGISQMSI